MSAKFFESIGSKLAEKWVATLLTPAFIFWAGGAIVGIQIIGWTDIHDWFTQQPEPLQIALLIAILILITTSAFIIQRFDFAVLRFLEGYWHPWLRPLNRWFVGRASQRTQRMGNRWQQLKQLDDKAQHLIQIASSQSNLEQLDQHQRSEAIDLIWQHGNHSYASKTLLQALTNRELLQRLAEIRNEFGSLDWQYLHLPLPDQLMPTRLGNILRAAEQRPLEKYGLDAVICWSRLWLLLPDSVKQELQSARAELNTAARVWLWSLLFILWAFISAGWTEKPWWTSPLDILSVCWPALVGILSAYFTYRNWAIAAATTYGELIEATFDLYRHLLYDSLRWHLPTNPNEERRVGQQLTEYLLRGEVSSM